MQENITWFDTNKHHIHIELVVTNPKGIIYTENLVQRIDGINGFKDRVYALFFDLDILPALDSTVNFTMEAWIKANFSQLAYPSIIGRRNPSGSNNGYLFFLWTDGRLAYQLNDGSYKNYQSTSNDLRDDTWHNVTVTGDRDGYLTFYVDGVQKGQVDISTMGNINSTSNIFIGWDEGNPSNTFFNGVIGDIRVYNRALSAEEIQQLYNLPPDCADAEILPTTISHSSIAETGTIAISASPECSWTATSNADWATITFGENGEGNGTIAYEITENPRDGLFILLSNLAVAETVLSDQ